MKLQMILGLQFGDGYGVHPTTWRTPNPEGPTLRDNLRGRQQYGPEPRLTLEQK